jgi:hypothetical protein
MRKLSIAVIALAACAIAMPANARKQPNAALQTLDDFFAGDLINDPTSLDWAKWGGLKSKTVDAKETPGQFALQATIKAAGAKAYDAGLNIPLTGNINKGDRVQVKLWARTVSAEAANGKANVIVRLQQNVEPYDGFGELPLQPGSEWKLYEFETTATRALSASDGQLSLQLATQKQVVEIGQVYVMNMAASN